MQGSGAGQAIEGKLGTKADFATTNDLFNPHLTTVAVPSDISSRESRVDRPNFDIRINNISIGTTSLDSRRNA